MTSSARHKKNPQQSFELLQQERRLSALLQLPEKHYSIAESQRRKAMDKFEATAVYKDNFVCSKLTPLPVPTIKTSPNLPSRITPRNRLLRIRCNSAVPHNLSSKLGLPEIKDLKRDQQRKPLPPINK